MQNRLYLEDDIQKKAERPIASTLPNLVLAFKLPNEKLTGKNFKEFRESVCEIEELTGIYFQAALSARDERWLESGAAELWRRNKNQERVMQFA